MGMFDDLIPKQAGGATGGFSDLIPKSANTTSQIPGAPSSPPPVSTAPPPGFMDKLKGAGEAAFSAASGMLAAPVSQIAGIGSTLTSGQYGKPSGIQVGQDTAAKVQQAMTYQPRGEVGQNIMQGFGKAMDASKLAGLNPAQAMPMGAIAKPGAGVLREAAGQIPMPVSPTLQKAGAAVKGAVMPKIDPQTADLARKGQGMGIQIPPDMLTENKFARIAGQASRDIPATGSPVAGNREAFNRAIIKSFGGDEQAAKISPKIYREAMDKHGGTIGDISEKYPINYPKQLKDKLFEYEWGVRNETPDVRRVIEGYLSDIRTSASKQGVIDGAAFRKLRSELTAQMRRSKDGDLKHALSDLDDVMLDTIQSNLSKEELTQFNQARTYYHNGKTVEPLIAKAAAKGQGDMSPAALSQAITSSSGKKTSVAKGRGGELADISAVGSRFMTEPKSSNTTERGLVYGGLLGGGAMVEPHTAAGLYGLANLYNRLGPRMTRGMIPPPP